MTPDNTMVLSASTINQLHRFTTRLYGAAHFCLLMYVHTYVHRLLPNPNRTKPNRAKQTQPNTSTSERTLRSSIFNVILNEIQFENFWNFGRVLILSAARNSKNWLLAKDDTHLCYWSMQEVFNHINNFLHN